MVPTTMNLTIVPRREERFLLLEGLLVLPPGIGVRDDARPTWTWRPRP